MQTPAPLVCQSSGCLSGSPPFAEIHLYSIAFLYPTDGFLFLSPTGNLLPVVAITIYVSDSPLFPVAGKVGKRAVFDIRRKGNPKTIGFWRKLPKRRLWQIQPGGFEEVSRFSRHNVAGNRLARRRRLSAAIRGKLYPPEVINHFWQSICLRSSPHKYSPIRQFFTISSYFSGLVKFS